MKPFLLFLALFFLNVGIASSQNAVTSDLESKLRLRGYSDKEIADVLSGKVSLEELKLRLKLSSVGYPPEDIDVIIQRKISIAELELRQKLIMLAYKKEEIESVVSRFFPKRNIINRSNDQSVPVLALRGLKKRETLFKEIVAMAAKRHDVEQAWIYAVMRQESSFNSVAVSQKGAQGLMQLMPGTAYMLGVNDAFNPSENIMGGTKYLKQLIIQFDGNMDKVLAAYNSGPERVARLGRVPRIEETINYVKMVKLYYRQYSKLELAQASTD